MRKAVLIVGCMAVVVMLLAVATVIVVNVKHPRDEKAYVAYLQKYGSDSGTPITLPATRLVIAEGDHACNWLSNAPTALWRTGNRYRYQAVLTHYRLAVRGRPLA